MSEPTPVSRKREEFKFRYSPYGDTQDGVLMAYLKQGDGLRPGKEMLLESVRAFWLPIAYQSQGDLDQEELRLIGLKCCRALERQIDYIRECLQLPYPVSSRSIFSDSDDLKNGNKWNSNGSASERVTKAMWQ